MIPLTPDPVTGRYYATLKGAPGQRARKVSLRTTSRAAARRLVKDARLDEIQRTAQADALNAEAITRLRTGRRLSIEAAIGDYLEMMPAQGQRLTTIKHSTAVLRRWVARMGLRKLALAASAEKHVSGFVNARGAQKFSTRKRELMVLRGFFRFCVNRGWIASNPAGNVVVNVDRLSQAQLTEGETEPLTPAEIGKILTATGPDDFWHAATLIAWHAGLRLFNVATLEWNGLAVPGQLRVFTTKGEETVRVELTPELKALFARWPQADSRYLFPPQAASILLDGPSTLSQQFRRLCLRLGIEGKSFHSLRHSFALRSMDGVTDSKLRLLADLIGSDSIDEVRRLLGHAKVNTTLRYLNHPRK